MRDIIVEIKDKLDEIERTESVRILHAVESGSRAWGFASPDSDYDVRFVYVRSKNDYLRLDEPRDVIEWQLDELLEGKKRTTEREENPQLPVMREFIESETARQKEIANHLKDDHNRDWTALNSIFLEIINGEHRW